MKRILLDPGHSKQSKGTHSADGGISEYECNVYQAEVLKNILTPFFQVDIVDPEKDDRMFIGSQAKNYDAFISLHLNSFDKARNYTCCLIDSRYEKPTSKTVMVTSKIAQAIATALKIPCYRGAVWPIGVMPSQLEVLSSAEKSKCPMVFLVESFFLDYYVNIETITKNIELAMAAMALCIKKELK